jgi:hypothetical protein
VVRAEGKVATFLRLAYRDIMVNMVKQETVIPQKRRGPAPTGKGTPIVTRVQPEMLKKIDGYIARQKESISRPEAVRRLVELGLKKGKR